MRILLDECLPRRLKRDLAGHEVRSVPEMGWAGKTNGALLSVAQTDFDVFLTVDRNLSFQQDINKFNIAVVIPEVLSVLAALAPGQVVKVGA